MEDKIRKIVCESGKKLVESGLSQGTWGNVSMRLDSLNMIITPSGRDYLDLKPEDMVLVNIETLKWNGENKPSSESEMHAEIYKKRKSINGIIHTHSENVCTIAAARVDLPPVLDDMAQIIGPSVKVSKYALSGTKKMVKEVMKVLPGRNACILANHGAVCLGRTLDEAFTVNQILEKACRVFLECSFLGGAKQINKKEAKLMHELYMKKYSKKDQEEKLKVLGIKF